MVVTTASTVVLSRTAHRYLFYQTEPDACDAAKGRRLSYFGL